MKAKNKLRVKTLLTGLVVVAPIATVTSCNLSKDDDKDKTAVEVMPSGRSDSNGNNRDGSNVDSRGGQDRSGENTDNGSNTNRNNRDGESTGTDTGGSNIDSRGSQDRSGESTDNGSNTNRNDRDGESTDTGGSNVDSRGGQDRSGENTDSGSNTNRNDRDGGQSRGGTSEGDKKPKETKYKVPVRKVPKYTSSINSLMENVSKGQRISDPTKAKHVSTEDIQRSLNSNNKRQNDKKIQDPDTEATKKIWEQSYLAPYYDLGYTEYKFMKNNGKYFIDNLKKRGVKNIRLGFITAFNDRKPLGNNLHREMKKLHDDNPNLVIPTISGQLPLWYPNHITENNDDSDGTQDKMYSFLSEIRKAGLDYTFSYGGWNDNTLATQAFVKKYTAQDLKELYAGTMDKLNIKHIDFDIEGRENGEPDDFGNQPLGGQDSLVVFKVRQLRLDALKLLREDPKYQDVRITFTVPTAITGVVYNQNQWMIEQAIRDNIVDEVDVMAMDFWEHKNTVAGFTLPGEMGLAAINSLNALKEVVKNAGNLTDEEAFNKIGVIPMYGINDRPYEVFDITSAVLLSNWAVKNHLKSITGWSGIRETWQHLKTQDQFRYEPNTNTWKSSDLASDLIHARSVTTGLGTSDFAFAEIFSNFNGGITIDPLKYSKKQDFNMKDYLKILSREWDFTEVEDIYNNTKPIDDIATRHGGNSGLIHNPHITKEQRNKMFDAEKGIWKLYINI